MVFRNLLLIGSIILGFSSANAQKIKINACVLLPKALHESSGLWVSERYGIWTINDSGHLPNIYRIDSSAQIVDSLVLEGVSNTDWEELSTDGLGYVYVADIGNNTNRRTDLKIYKIPEHIFENADHFNPEIISFSYANQTEFPPAEPCLNFDAEAVVAYADSLFIVTKNRTKPYTQMAYIYSVPNRVGQHTAVLCDSLFLEHTRKNFSWVTGATRLGISDTVMLISHRKAWLIPNFRTGHKSIVPMKISGIYSQKEAISALSQNQIWITNEKFKFLRAKIKKGRIKL